MEREGLQKIDTLDYLLIQAIAEERSLTAAAKRLGMSGSAIGQRITKLENKLDHVIVHRQRRPQLTKAGDAFLASAKVILKEIARLDAKLSDTKDDIESFYLMVNPSIAISDLLHVFERMIQLNPKIKPILTEGSTKEILNGVLSGEQHAGIVVGKFNVPGLRFVPYKQDRFCIVAPISHALSQMKQVKIKDALKHPLIGTTSKQINDYIDHVAKSLGVKIHYRIVVSSFEAQMNIVAQTDIGVAVVAESLAKRFAKLHPIKIINLEDQFEDADFAICVPEKGFASELSIEFTRNLINRFKVPGKIQ